MSQYSKEKIDVAVILERETEKALLVNDGHKSFWVPNRQCEVNYNHKGIAETVTMPEWLAYDKGLI